MRKPGPHALELTLSTRIAFGLITSCYMATGVYVLAVCIYFAQTSSTSRRAVIITPNILATLITAGSYTVTTALIGIYGSLSPISRKPHLIAYAFSIILNMFVSTCIGMWMWVRTLDVHSMYAYNWRHVWPNGVRRGFQDTNICCGYLSPLDSPVQGSHSCLNKDVYGCMVFVQTYAQGYLSYVYTWLFVFVVVDVVALLGVLVVLVVRNDEERLRWSRANAIFR
ncbi:hypothetical protein GGH98_003657, partial [Coemansia sp. RSA 454]